jgi:uncharacterized protein
LRLFLGRVKSREMAPPSSSPSNRTFRIGVIADTHDRWAPEVAEVFRGVDEIWHLGDVCSESVLDHLRELAETVEVVLGNNDYALSYPVTRRLERGGEKFYLVHILPTPLPQDADWILFGHTHRPTLERSGRLRLFNPGSAGKANKGAPASVGLLTADEAGGFRAEVVRLAEVRARSDQ